MKIIKRLLLKLILSDVEYIYVCDLIKKDFLFTNYDEELNRLSSTEDDFEMLSDIGCVKSSDRKKTLIAAFRLLDTIGASHLKK